MFTRILVVVIILLLAAGVAYFLTSQEEPFCQVCQRPMHPGTHYVVSLNNGETVRLCCPRCGLHFQSNHEGVVRSQAADFNSGELLEADRAFFVEGSSVRPCSMGPLQKDKSGIEYEIAWDRCLPSLVAFKTVEDAQAFREEHGGAVKTFSELLEELR